ncbi:MAG TPA: hypothetical protein VMG34_09325, partial [Bacteroidota bacterium]|nr:hypothetical protein [Bacteroidota bacterium]
LPDLATKSLGAQQPAIIGIIRGTGGSIIGATLFYILIALKPLERRWAAIVMALGNILAIILDLVSVHLGEFTLDHAMIDVPVEALSLLTIALFYSLNRDSQADTASPRPDFPADESSEV